MTKIVHTIKGGLLSYCGKVYSHGNIDQKHRIGGVMVRVLTCEHAQNTAGWVNESPQKMGIIDG